MRQNPRGEPGADYDCVRKGQPAGPGDGNYPWKRRLYGEAVFAAGAGGQVKALFRRAEYSRTEAPTAFRCGNLLLEQGARTITVGGEAFSVTPTEFDFLSYLLERAGQAVSKQELMREIWKLPDYELDTRVADDLVKRLRRKLKEAGCSASVKTVWGFGFRLEGGKEGET